MVRDGPVPSHLSEVLPHVFAKTCQTLTSNNMPGGGELTYMSNIGMYRGKDPLF